MQWLSASNQNMVLVASGVVSVVSLLFAIVALIMLLILRRRFKRWKAIHETADLDLVYRNTQGEVREVRDHMERLETSFGELRQAMRRKVSTPEMLRFKAFPDQGADLSFAVALMDEEQNGFVLSSIYGREESRIYGKPVEAGRSSYPLTDEERNAIVRTAAAQRDRVGV